MKLIVLTLFCFLLCACQAAKIENTACPPQAKQTLDFNKEYREALTAYDVFLKGESGLNGSPLSTIAPTPEAKYAILDMNDDGIPELAVTTVIFQNRDPDTLELESTFFDSGIFSYQDGKIVLWSGGNDRHHEYEILSNKALLYDYDDGTGLHEIIYEELDTQGKPSHQVRLYRYNDTGRCYLATDDLSTPDTEISVGEWDEFVNTIQILRTDLIPWADFPESQVEDFASEKLVWLGESRNDGWRCEGACVNLNGISCGSFLVRIISPDGSTFQETALSAESRIMPTGRAHWEDVNFDGKLDVLVHLGGGRGGTQGYAVMLWNETVGGYQEAPVYAEIGNPTPDSEHKIIWDGTDTSSQLDLSAWEYLNGNLVKTHQLSVLYHSSAEQSVSFTEYELENGTLSKIQHSFVMPDNIKDIDTYISTYAAWEGRKWCDIQHFQQKG